MSVCKQTPGKNVQLSQSANEEKFFNAIFENFKFEMHNSKVYGVYDKNWGLLKRWKLVYFATKSDILVAQPKYHVTQACDVMVGAKQQPIWMTAGNQKVEEGNIALLALLTVRAARTDARKESWCISFHLIKFSGPNGWSLFEGILNALFT